MEGSKEVGNTIKRDKIKSGGVLCTVYGLPLRSQINDPLLLKNLSNISYLNTNKQILIDNNVSEQTKRIFLEVTSRFMILQLGFWLGEQRTLTDQRKQKVLDLVSGVYSSLP